MSLDINAVRERANKAAPGPWTASGTQIIRNRTGETVANSLYDEETARFVAAAREDITALIGEIKALKNEMAYKMYFFADELLPEELGYYVTARSVEEAIGVFINFSIEGFCTASLVEPSEVVRIKIDQNTVTSTAGALCQECTTSILLKVPSWD